MSSSFVLSVMQGRKNEGGIAFSFVSIAAMIYVRFQ